MLLLFLLLLLLLLTLGRCSLVDLLRQSKCGLRSKRLPVIDNFSGRGLHLVLMGSGRVSRKSFRGAHAQLSVLGPQGMELT